MVAVVLKKRFFLLVILGLAGFALLFLGLRGGVGVEAPSLPGMQVSTPSTGNIIIEENANGSAPENNLNNPRPQTASVHNQDFFIDYRLERDRTRGQQVEWLREVINNPGTVDETRQKAQEQLMAISRSMEKESELENLIRAKGFADAIVIMDENTATAVIAAGNIDSGEVTAITELVSRSTGMGQQKIAIINKI